MSSAATAERLRALHDRDAPLVLANAWDVMSARALEDCGFAALGTTSFGIARAHGLLDGEDAALEPTVATVARMTMALSIPLTVDLEAGHGDAAESARRVIEAGAAGINLEDGQEGAGQPLADVEVQCERIRAVRALGAPVFLNARTDVFWLGAGDLDEALRRARAYVEAGADGIFIPGLTDPGAIATAARALPVPLNVLAGPSTPPVGELAALGVRRVSLGSGPARATLALLREIGREVLDHGTYRSLERAIPYREANRP